MVAELTGHAAANVNAPRRHTHFWRMVLDVAIRFYRADFTICLCSAALVMRRLWDPACRSVWPWETHWFHIRMTVYGCRPLRRKISRKDNPHSRYTTIIPLSDSSTYWYAFLLVIRDITRYSERTLTLQSAYPMRNALHNFFYAMFHMLFLPSALSKCTEILIIFISPLLPFMQFWRSSDYFFAQLTRSTGYGAK